MSKYRRNDYDEDGDFSGLVFIIIIGVIIPFIQKHWLVIVMVLSVVLIYFIIRIIIDMDLNSKFKRPLLYFEGKNSDAWLKTLEESNNEYDKIKLKKLKQGKNGEKSVIYELENSRIPMYIMHDVKVEYDNYTAQIDVLAVTKKQIYIFEVKNLIGNVVINKNGEIKRYLKRGKRGFKNPKTQTEKQMNIIIDILRKEKTKENLNFWTILTNNESCVEYKRGAEDVADEIMRNDLLINNIKKNEKKKHIKRQEDGIKKICDAILKYQVKQESVKENKDECLYLELKEYRNRKRIEENVEAYFVFNNETLDDLINKKPKTNEELYKVVGFGKIKTDKYGSEIIKIISKY